MPRGDVYYLVALAVFSVAGFLPFARHVAVDGMALMGWMMAALMLFSPAVALWRLRGRRR